MINVIKRRKRVLGFSLVEVMVSASLFAVTVVGVCTSTRMLTDQAAHARQMTMATHLAEFTIEELLLRFEGDDDLRSDIPHSREFSTVGDPAPAGTGFFVATWTVAPVPTVSTLKMINVVLTWHEHTSNDVPTGSTKTISLITYRK